jgi:nucleoside-diphosphate-sugar epimerase
MKILVLGGNRYFGKRLVGKLLDKGHDVTVLNRGHVPDDFGPQIKRIIADRADIQQLRIAANCDWDLIYDQICFESQDARNSVELFSGRTKHYVLTSSQSVYSGGPDLKEEMFDPRQYDFSQNAAAKEDYAEAKRQCEAVFFQSRMKSIVSAVRFPIVLGPDDYTGRLKFHIEHIKNGNPFYLPNKHAKISFVHSEEAAEALLFLSLSKALGPLNVASPHPIELAQLLSRIESAVGRSAKLSESPIDADYSPYGIEKDWWMNIDYLVQIGFRPKSISEWIDTVILESLNQSRV